MQILRTLTNIYRKILRITLPIAFIFVAFLLWSSWSNVDEDDYAHLITNSYPESTDADSIYSIISYNIGYLSGMTNNLPVSRTESLFADNLKIVKAELEAVNADILCFQEIDYHSKRSFYVNQQEEIQKLGYNYVFQAINWDKKYLPYPGFLFTKHFGEILSGQSIISKFPISETKRIVLERPNEGFTTNDIKSVATLFKGANILLTNAYYLDRLAQVIKVRINGKTVVVINVHLEAFEKEARDMQVATVSDLYKSYKDDFPIFLVGDFNSDINYENASIETILALPGIRSASILGEKTFPSSNPKDRLDYIFYNEDYIELKRAKVLSSFGEASDHLPIMMEFTLK